MHFVIYCVKIGDPGMIIIVRDGCTVVFICQSCCFIQLAKYSTCSCHKCYCNCSLYVVWHQVSFDERRSGHDQHFFSFFLQTSIAWMRDADVSGLPWKHVWPRGCISLLGNRWRLITWRASGCRKSA